VSFCRHVTCVEGMRLELSCLLGGKTVTWSTSLFCGHFHGSWPFCVTCP
jgi:hypothetical protein